MTTNKITSRTLRTIAAVAVAALIAAACGSDEPAVEPEQVEAPGTTTAAAEVGTSEAAVVEETASAVIEEEPEDEPAAEELPIEEPELGPDLDTAPDESAVEPDEVSQPEEAPEPASEPEPEEAPKPEQEQPEPEETSQPVEPVEDAPEPETTLPPEEPVEQEPDDPPTSTVPEVAADDPWERVVHEPVLASELWPEGAENGDPYPDDLFCHVPSGGELEDLECYYTTPEPEPEPEPLVEDTESEYSSFVQSVQQGQTWTDSEPPSVHPDTKPASWERGIYDRFTGRPDDRPRLSIGVAEWINWCTTNYRGNQGCNQMLYTMTWALDYLGANQACILDTYTERIERGNNPNVYERYNDSRLTNQYGWHRCASVIDPLQPDGSLLSQQGLSMAERCRSVLPDDVELERYETIHVVYDGLDCVEWGDWVAGTTTGALGDCFQSVELAHEWLEHYFRMPEIFYDIGC